MANGFTRPLSPSGKASIIPPLPWNFAGDMLLIHFKSDPAALARYLPLPLEPADEKGDAFLWTLQFSCHPAGGDPRELDPAQTGYNVCVVGIPALLHGKPTLFSAFQWCDKDWLIVLSWFIGASSKGAEFHTTHRHPLMSTFGSPNCGGVGSEVHRSVSRFGSRIIDMRIKPEREISMKELTPFMSRLPLTGMRHMPDVTLPPSGKPPVHDLVQQILSNANFGTPLAGSAALTFLDHPNEELLPIQPLEVVGGYVLPLAQTLEGIRIVHDYNACS